MDWLYGLKLVLLASGSILILTISFFVYQLVCIASEVRAIIQRVEMATDYRNWISFIKLN